MRKFTKEITALLAAAAVGSAAAVVNAEPLIKESETNTASCENDMNGIREEGVAAVTDDMIGYDTDLYEVGTGWVTTEDGFGPFKTVGDMAVSDQYIEAPATTTVTSYTGMIGTEWPTHTDPPPTAPYTGKEEQLPDNGITTVPDTEVFYAGVMAVLDGDVNGDYVVNASDLAVLTRVLLGSANEVYIQSGADLNYDGKVSIVDLILLKDKLIGS